MRRLLPPIGVVIALLTPLPAAAQNAPLEHFLSQLQAAVDRDDRQAVAALFQYPATLLAGGLGIPLRDRAGLLDVYRLALAPEVKGIILLAGVPKPGQATPLYSVRSTEGGASIGGTAIALQRVGGSYRISRISAPAGVRPQSRELTTRKPGVWEAAGSLVTYQMETFTISARRNQLITLVLDGFRARDIVARIVNVATGEPIARTGAGVRRWSGQAPAAGDYRVEIIRANQAGPDVLIYSLAITLH